MFVCINLRGHMLQPLEDLMHLFYKLLQSSHAIEIFVFIFTQNDFSDILFVINTFFLMFVYINLRGTYVATFGEIDTFILQIILM